MKRVKTETNPEPITDVVKKQTSIKDAKEYTICHKAAWMQRCVGSLDLPMEIACKPLKAYYFSSSWLG